MTNNILEIIDNPQLINELYATPPVLDTLEQCRVSIESGGMTITGDLATFPDTPPKDWLWNGFNKTSWTFILYGMRDFQVFGLHKGEPVALELNRTAPDCISVRLSVSKDGRNLLVASVAGVKLVTIIGDIDYSRERRKQCWLLHECLPGMREVCECCDHKAGFVNKSDEPCAAALKAIAGLM